MISNVGYGVEDFNNEFKDSWKPSVLDRYCA